MSSRMVLLGFYCLASQRTPEYRLKQGPLPQSGGSIKCSVCSGTSWSVLFFLGSFSISLQTLMCLCIHLCSFCNSSFMSLWCTSILSLLSYCLWVVCVSFVSFTSLFKWTVFIPLLVVWESLSSSFYTRLFSLWGDLHLFVQTVNSNKSPQAEGVRGPGETLCLLGPSSNPPPHSDHPGYPCALDDLL